MKKELAKTNKKREVALIDGNEEEKVIKKKITPSYSPPSLTE